MTRMMPVGAALALMAFGPLTHAEEGGVVRVSVAEAIARAREVSARRGQFQALERASNAALDGARAQRWPVLEASGAYSRNSEVPELRLRMADGSWQTLFPNIPDQYRLRAGLTLPVYSGGRIEGGIAAAEQQAVAAHADLATLEKDLALETATAFWFLVTDRESARVLEEGLAAYESHLKDGRNRMDLGMAASDEVLAVQVERDRAELVRLEAAHAALVADADLARLLDLPPGSRIEPTDSVVASEVPGGEIEALVAEAAAGRPEIQALSARIAATEASVRVARAASLPQAAVSANADRARPNTRVLPLEDQWKSTWSVGFNLTWNVFDGGRASAAVAQARAQAEAVRKQLDDVLERVRLEVTVRYLDVQTAQAALRVAESALGAARESQRIAQDRYREGLIPSSELLDAETRLLRSGLDRNSAASRIRVAQARLDRAVGR